MFVFFALSHYLRLQCCKRMSDVRYSNKGVHLKKRDKKANSGLLSAHACKTV